MDVTDFHSPAVQSLFRLAAEQNILTIGIGDVGNEIGAAVIEPVIRTLVPFGDMCKCDCRAGIASSVGTDIYVPAAISDWGAYGIAASLCFLSGSPDAFPAPELLHAVLDACVREGAFDSVTLRPEPSVDGAPLGTQLAVVTMLQSMLASALVRRTRPF